MITRRGHDRSERYPLTATATAALPLDATIDGEAVVCDEAGIERLHSHEHDSQAILELDGAGLCVGRIYQMDRRRQFGSTYHVPSRDLTKP